MIEKNRSASRPTEPDPKDFEGQIDRIAQPTDPTPDLAWALSGAMALTGWADAAPKLAATPLVARACAAWQVLRSLAVQAPPDLDAGALLGERAAALGLSRSGNHSPSGSCRLLPVADGFIALNLARESDRQLLPAWLEAEVGNDAWESIESLISGRPGQMLVSRGRLLGLPVAHAGAPPRVDAWCKASTLAAASGRRRERPVVLDLSALWAGPLCTQLLGLAGARIIKVESTERPDGARDGPTDFFDLLNADKETVTLDLRSERGVASLRALISNADVIVESARPRALAQLGIDAAQEVAAADGLTWVSITGYGRDDPFGNWVAFGDDAAAAGGLAVATGDAERGPIFCADAIADPLTGLHAAAAAMASLRAGGGRLLDIALERVVASTFWQRLPGHRQSKVLRNDDGSFRVSASGDQATVLPPRMRSAKGRAPALGADTERVLREFGAC